MRESNFELLRIVAMLLVILVHVVATFHYPNFDEISTCPVSSFGFNLASALSLGSIHLFVLISGYFGIRLSVKSVSSFTFQVVFYLFTIHLLFVLLNGGGRIISFIKTCLPINGTSGNWFVAAYFGLMLLSPVVNKWLSSINIKVLRNYLIVFYLFAFLFAWLFDNPYLGFNRGSSVLAFLGLYCLGDYLRRLKDEDKLSLSKYTYLGIAFSIACFSALIVTLYVFCSKTDFNFDNSIRTRWIAYLSPLTILYAIMLFIFFSKISLQSKLINWISASAFSVYLIHRNDDVYDFYFKNFLRWLHHHTEFPAFMLYTIIFMIVLFMLCVLIDQVRIYIWNKVWNLSQRLIYK